MSVWVSKSRLINKGYLGLYTLTHSSVCETMNWRTNKAVPRGSRPCGLKLKHPPTIPNFDQSKQLGRWREVSSQEQGQVLKPQKRDEHSKSLYQRFISLLKEELLSLSSPSNFYAPSVITLSLTSGVGFSFFTSFKLSCCLDNSDF